MFVEERIMKVKRDRKIYEAIKYLPESQEVCVLVEFDFATEPRKRKLKLWWNLADCEIIEEKNNAGKR
jgi:predicted ATP-grasp superfamily ATP-dependent carboligase